MKKLSKTVIVLLGIGSSLFVFASNTYAAATVPDFLCPVAGPTGTAAVCGLDLATALPNALNILLFVAFVAALIYLVYGGIRWVISGGDKEGTAKAKGTVTAALIGLAIVLASWLLVNIVLGFFGIDNFSVIPNLFGTGT